MKVKDIVSHLNSFAPGVYQESYDNAQLLTGDREQIVQSVLLTLDCTEEVVDEAIQNGHQMIVAHHPIIFSGLKSLTGKNYVERTIIKAIKNDIAIFAIHTNLDNVKGGVNTALANKLGLTNQTPLSTKPGTLLKLTFYVPKDDTKRVLQAVNDAGAGQIGDYINCAFTVDGTGQFEPTPNANPHIGEAGKLEQVKEQKVEVIFPKDKKGALLKALFESHPYEEVAYYIHDTENQNQDIGSGMVGDLNQPMSGEQFLAFIKDELNLKVVRRTKFLNKNIQKVAVCGGSGSFLLNDAISARADVFITGDFKYHEFFDAEDSIVIMDIGHYESEVHTKDLLKDILTEKFTNIAFVLSNLDTNPIVYS